MIKKSARMTFSLLFVLVLVASLVQGQSSPSPPLDAARKKVIIEEISTLLKDNYIFLETAEKIGNALRTRLKDGTFNSVDGPASFARAVSAILAEVGKDKHMGFNHNPAAAENMRRLQG